MCNEAPNSVSWLLISSFGDLGHGNEILMHGFLSLSIFLETCYLCLLALSFGSSQCLFEILVECVCSWLNVLGFRFIGLHDGLNNVGFSVPQVWLCLGRVFFVEFWVHVGLGDGGRYSPSNGCCLQPSRYLAPPTTPSTNAEILCKNTQMQKPIGGKVHAK